MNKGSAKIFRRLYPEMASCISQKLDIGKAMKYQERDLTFYNLVTKHKVWQKARGDYEEQYYQQLYEALEHMKDQMIKGGESYLAIPKIASGLDEGNCYKVRDFIKNIFFDAEITIQINFL